MPPTHISYMAGDSHVEAVYRSLVAREAAIALLQFHLERAQKRIKMFVDKDISDRSFAVGDWVLLKLQPYRQVTFRMHKQHKFSPKFNGPFQVEAKCGEVAYKLTLPDAATIHNWSNGNVDDATWEVATDLQARYPAFDLNP
ncbi:hypothetical protein Tco_1316238 [Tanacetum coccineum]